MLKTAATIFGIAVLFCTSTFAQTDFFWSFNDLNSGAVNSPAKGVFRPGDTATLFLYYSTVNSDLDTGAGLDISLSNDATIDFMAARTFDFDIVVAGTDVGNRWLGNNGGNGLVGDAQSVTANNIEGLNAAAFVGGGSGILMENGANGTLMDIGYDPDSDAFLFGSIDFVVGGSPGSTTQIVTDVGTIGIAHNGQPLNPTFGTATISVVPEPKTFCGFVCLACFALRRQSLR